MDTILIIVLSVLSTLLLLWFIWATMGLRKVLKQTKQNTDDIESNYEDHNMIRESSNNDYKEYDKKIDEVHQRIETESNNFSVSIDEAVKNIYQDNHDWREIGEKNLDRRFNTLYELLYEHFPQLKKKD